MTGLLAAILILGLPLAGIHHQLNKRASHEQRLRAKLGGGVFLGYSPHLPKHGLYGFFEDTHNINQICEIGLFGESHTDADLFVLDEIPNLEKIRLHITKVTDEGLMHLARHHPRLQTLDIDSRIITKEGIARLKLARPGVKVILNYRVQ
jgi:hypothetical protein